MVIYNNEYKDWIKADKDPSCAFCSYCKRKFSVADQGVKQINSHMNSGKQQKADYIRFSVN